MEARVIGGRFRILHEVAQGGAGTIYKALDLRSEQYVGLKMMRGLGAIDEARFAREARVLAQIEDPGLVRYLGHGVEAGLPFLAMEWLEGEDLRARLLREGLTPAATLALGHRAAAVLAVLHLHGLVHRDIKPGNLFLVGGRPEDVKVLDLGLVRGGVEQASLTHTGLAVGTPGYMAPEQARGQRDVDARADVFSLGCVLYRCLSGKAPFEGSHLVEVMTKVLLEEPESLNKLCPGVPGDLAALVHRMLAKDPDARPRSGAELVAAFAGVGLDASASDMVSAPVSRRGASITSEEKRLASVLLVGPEGERPSEDTYDGFAEREAPAAIDGVLRTYGAAIEHLAGDVAVVHLHGGAGPGDAIVRAALPRALSIRAALPRAPIAFATGLSDQSGKAPVGDAIERATRMLASEQASLDRALAEGRPCPAWIAIDAVTASLLGSAFDVREADGAWRLHGTADDSGSARALLGKQIPLVGREWEMGTITGAFRSCVDEPGPRVVLVTGPGGAGKSRLAREVRGALSDVAPDVQIWTAAGASAAAGSSLSLLAELLASALSLHGAAPDAQERLLSEAVRDRLPSDKAPRVIEILAEVLGIKLSSPSAALRAARSDPRIFGERTREAFEDLLSASAARGPVVILLEDLHWGDASTTRVIGDVLGSLRDRPFMVLAFARPDIGSLFPHLWHEHDCQHIRLRPLTKKASEQIVRHVLGPEAPAAAVSRIIAQADGNAFFLEELIRAFAARGATDGPAPPPETVLAVVQARLSQLDSEARRVLRAASIFGEVFWPSAVEALVGRDPSWSAGLWVDALVSQEILVRRPHSRFEGESELAFRHSLLREGAYAMLTESDRVLGHRIAGEWLQERGEADPLVLAKHFDEGQDPGRAARCHLEAARRAVAGMDLTAAVERAEHARMLSVSMESEGAFGSATDLRRDCDLVLAEAHLWRSEWAEVASHTAEVILASRPGTGPWIRALSFKQSAEFSLRDVTGLMQSIIALTSVEPEPEARPAAIQSLGVSVLVLGLGAQLPMARALLPRLEAMVSSVPERHLVPLGWASTARGLVAAWGDGDPWAAMHHLNTACELFDEAGDRQNAGFLHGMAGTIGLEMLGTADRAREELARIPASDDPVSLVGAVRDDLVVLLALRRRDHALVRGAAAARLSAAEGGGIMAQMRAARARVFLGEIAEREGDLETAERELSRAAASLRLLTPTLWPETAAMLARVELALGRLPEAEKTIREVKESLSQGQIHGLGAPLAHLVYAEILLARGDREAALADLTRSRDRLLAMAGRIPDEALRTAYLRDVPAHDRTLSFAAELSASTPASPN